MVVAWGPCLLLATASYAMILRPRLEYKRELAAKVLSSKEQYARALEAAKEKDQGRLAGQVESLRDQIADFVVRLDDAPNLAFRIGAMANEARLESFGMRPLNRQGPDTLSEPQSFVEKHLDLTFCAGFGRFAAFLNMLERHHPVFFVETFAISRAPEEDAEPRANMELTVLVEKPPGQ